MKRLYNNHRYLDTLQKHIIIFDGAMGTILHQRGVSFEECFDMPPFNRYDLAAELIEMIRSQ